MAVHNYLIGIGGSGAKCVESLVHLAATGAFVSQEPVHLAIIDPDLTNWNLKALKKTLADYSQTQQILAFKQQSKHRKKDEAPWFGVDFVSLGQNDQSTRDFDHVVWSPNDTEDTSLRLLLDRSQPTEHEQLLFRTLFSPDELNEKLQFGFKGHPAIGSLLLAKSFRPEITLEESKNGHLDENDTYWSRFCGKQSTISSIVADGTSQVRIMVVGSIFGGTGASGVPTVIRKLYDLYQAEIAEKRVQLGLMLMLPYFKFNKTNDGMKDGSLCAESEEFVLNSKYALRYYHDFDVSKSVNRTYLIGSDFYENLAFAVGGVDQQNKALFPELIAAIGIQQFFTDAEILSIGSLKSVLYARRITINSAAHSASSVSFDEIPDDKIVKPAMLHFLRFSLVFNRLMKIAQQVCRKPKLGRSETWVPEYFPVLRQKPSRKPSGDSERVHSKEAERDQLSKDIETISQYLTRFLDWSVDLLCYVEEIYDYKINEIRKGTGNEGFDLKDVSTKTSSIKFEKIKGIIRDEHHKKNVSSFYQLYEHVRKLTIV